MADSMITTILQVRDWTSWSSLHRLHVQRIWEYPSPLWNRYQWPIDWPRGRDIAFFSSDIIDRAQDCLSSTCAFAQRTFRILSIPELTAQKGQAAHLKMPLHSFSGVHLSRQNLFRW